MDPLCFNCLLESGNWLQAHASSAAVKAASALRFTSVAVILSGAMYRPLSAPSMKWLCTYWQPAQMWLSATRRWAMASVSALLKRKNSLPFLVMPRT